MSRIEAGMALNVLIIPDKFKGTLTAAAAAAAIASGWASVRPHDRLVRLPMSDGGDGFGEILSQLLQAEPRIVTTVDAAHRPRELFWWWQAATRTAIMESAQVIGLARLPPAIRQSSGRRLLYNDLAVSGGDCQRVRREHPVPNGDADIG